MKFTLRATCAVSRDRRSIAWLHPGPPPSCACGMEKAQSAMEAWPIWWRWKTAGTLRPTRYSISVEQHGCWMIDADIPSLSAAVVGAIGRDFHLAGKLVIA